MPCQIDLILLHIGANDRFIVSIAVFSIAAFVNQPRQKYFEEEHSSISSIESFQKQHPPTVTQAQLVRVKKGNYPQYPDRG